MPPDPHAVATWRAAWTDVAEALHRNVPPEIVATAQAVPASPHGWTAYVHEAGIAQLTTWHETQPLDVFPDMNGPPDLERWPRDVQQPPPEPPGARALLERDYEAGEAPRTAYGALGLLILGTARTVREECT